MASLTSDKYTTIDLSEFDPTVIHTQIEPAEIEATWRAIIGQFMAIDNQIHNYHPSWFMPKRSFSIETSMRPTGYVVQAPSEMLIPYEIFKQSLFSVACATEFRMPRSDVTADELNAFLSAEFGPNVIRPQYRCTVENIGKDLRDASPWIETLGNAGVAGYYRNTEDHSKWLAFVLVSEIEASQQIFDLRQGESYGMSTISDFMSNPTITRIIRASHRCARRILARLLCRVSAMGDAVRIVPDSESAVQSTQTQGDLSDQEYKLLRVRKQPFMAIPQYEQEFDVFVPGSTTGMACYCSGVVPSATLRGGLMISYGGLEQSKRLHNIMIRDISKITEAEYAQSNIVDDDVLACDPYIRKRLPKTRYYDTWMHSGIGLSDQSNVAQSGTDALHVASMLNEMPSTYESFARIVARPSSR